MEKTIKLERINQLLDTYGALLTNKQLQIMKEKYVYDLSLLEISEHFHISRAAVLDAINVAKKKLENYDHKLDLLKKKAMVLSLIKEPKIKDKIKEIL